MPVVFNKESGLAEDLPQAESQAALASGTHEVPLVSPDGKIGSADASSAPELVQQGYKQPNSEQLKGMLETAKHSTTEEKIMTGIEGVAHGVLGPIADTVALAHEVPLEDVRARAETNPEIHGAAEAAGLVGSGLAGVGLGGALNKAGSVIKAGKDASFIAKVAATAGRGAIENALFQTQDEFSHMVQNDPAQTVESAISHVGMSALLGAGVGGGLGGVGASWDAFMGSKAAKFIDDFKGMTKEHLGIPNLENQVAEQSHSAVTTKEFSNKIQDVLQHENPLYKANITSYTPEEYSKFRKFLSSDKQSGYAVKPDGELVSVFSLEKGRGQSLVDDAVLNKGAKHLDAFDINNKLPKLYGKYMNETSRLKFADEYAPEGWDYDKLGRPDIVPMKLRNPNLGPKYSDNPTSPFSKPDIFSPNAKGYPKEVIDYASTPGGKAANALIRNSLVDKLGGAMGAAAGSVVHHPILGYLFGEQTIAPMIKKVLPSIIRPLLDSDASGAGLKSAVNYTMAALKGENAIGKAAASVFGEAQHSADVTEKERADLKKQLATISANQEKLLDIGKQTGYYMPDHAQAMASTAMRNVQYLESLKPHTAPQAPLDKQRQTNAVEDAVYNRALDIAQNPLIVVKSIKDGSLTVKDIGHLKTMYPSLYSNLNQKIMNQLIDKKTDKGAIPYKTKLGLAAFMGQPLDSSMSPASIMASQGQGSTQQQMQQQPKNGTAPKNMNKLDKLPEQSNTMTGSREAYRTSRH